MQQQDKTLPPWLVDKLPEFERAEYIPQRFSDSTHELWRLNSKQGDHFLKVCSNTDSPFWQIMEDLFGVNLRNDIQYFDALYQKISAHSPLDIPELISADVVKGEGAFLLTQKLAGESLQTSQIGHIEIKQLADHLVHLHANIHSNWGRLHQPVFTDDDWPKRLKQVLQKSAKPRRSRDNVGALGKQDKLRQRRPEGRDFEEIESKWGGLKNSHQDYLQQALDACDSLAVDTFVPMMPDLRWDQFLQTKNGKLKLVDLDAFVIAPRELDFVLLEVILDANQLKQFAEIYSQHHDINDIASVRPAYRLLLYYMQILGEVDIDEWMNKPTVL